MWKLCQTNCAMWVLPFSCRTKCAMCESWSVPICRWCSRSIGWWFFALTNRPGGSRVEIIFLFRVIFSFITICLCLRFLFRFPFTTIDLCFYYFLDLLLSQSICLWIHTGMGVWNIPWDGFKRLVHKNRIKVIKHLRYSNWQLKTSKSPTAMRSCKNKILLWNYYQVNRCPVDRSLSN